MEERLIINVALTGMVPMKQDTPHLPVTPEEIAKDVLRCHNAGASIFHLHARDQQGQPAYHPDIYREIIQQIQATCPDDLILCVSTSGRTCPAFEQRSEVLDLEPPFTPDMASLTLGSLNFPQQTSVNTPNIIVQLAQKMRSHNISPELEIFEPGMIDYGHYLIRKGILKPPFYFNLLLGSLGTSAATPDNLVHMVNKLPDGATWAATGIGRFQFYMNGLAIAMGGHVRVGLEDNIYMDQAKTDLASNPRLVERLVKVARSLGREPATPAEARQIIGLPDASSRQKKILIS